MLRLRRALISRIGRAARLHPGAPGRAMEDVREWVSARGVADLALLLDSAGVISEAIAPDSAEEKLYDRAMHELIGAALIMLGYDLRDGGNGVCPTGPIRATWNGRNADRHHLRVEPRSVRLSRTATNPKDFGFGQLGRSRRPGEHTLLVAPIVAFPLGQGSRIYREAEQAGVTLVTYGHLAALLRVGTGRRDDLRPLADAFEFARLTAERRDGEVPTDTYWWALDQQVAAVAGVCSNGASLMRGAARSALGSLIRSETARLYSDRTNVRATSRERLVETVLEGRRVEERLRAIRARAMRAVDFLSP